jgi:hypothetical protein
MDGKHAIRAWTRAVVLALAPVVASAAPTPPPPAPQQPLGDVKVLQETPGTRTILDAGGHTHTVMSKVTPAQRRAAASRLKATRAAAARKAEATSPSTTEVTR